MTYHGYSDDRIRGSVNHSYDQLERERTRLQLKAFIDDWNANRLDLFAINEPNDELEFHGVMRFYFQESGQKVATKCIRVSSTATVRAVVEALVEKFHPDMKMLTLPNYSLWEIHENGAACERKMSPDEKPLLVQLNWHNDDREGRFLLKNDDDSLNVHISEDKENDPKMKRKLSKRERKEQKEQMKVEKLHRANSSTALNERPAVKAADSLYSQVPNTNFTRTISNPEIVMKKRRERKLEQKLKEITDGGSLKIYGQDLSSSKPYITLLVSMKDRADKIVNETLEKYGLDWRIESTFYELVMIKGETIRILENHERPLLLMTMEDKTNTATFHVRRRNRTPNFEQKVDPDHLQHPKMQNSPPPPVVKSTGESLPAVLEISNPQHEDEFINLLIRRIGFQESGEQSFKLSPAYVIYMCCRRKLATIRTKSENDVDRLRLCDFLTKIVDTLHVTVQDYCHDALNLAFWTSNCAELLNFMKNDSALCEISTPEPQESLIDVLEKAYQHLIVCFKLELRLCMPNVLKFDPTISESAALDEDQISTNQVIDCLNWCMDILRQCRFNAGLTIQIFSHNFHFINMYLFNWMISREGSIYCRRSWGRCLQNRLQIIKQWSERQGLEMAADCRLDKITHAAILLKSCKANPDDLYNLSNTVCLKLNSLQVKSLLERYTPDQQEVPIHPSFIRNLIQFSVNLCDEVLRRDEQPVHLEEDLELNTQLLIPDDGYSTDLVRGLTPGLKSFLDLLLKTGLCRVLVSSDSIGMWTCHFRNQEQEDQTPMVVKPIDYNPQQIDFCSLTIQKDPNGGVGLSIVQAQNESNQEEGIYIRKVVPNSAAFRDGRLKCGDQILAVNSQNVAGLPQEVVAQLIAHSGPTVTFQVDKGAAFRNGLSTWLTSDLEEQESPKIQTPNFNNGCNTKTFDSNQTVENFGPSGSLHRGDFKQIYSKKGDCRIPTVNQEKIISSPPILERSYEKSNFATNVPGVNQEPPMVSQHPFEKRNFSPLISTVNRTEPISPPVSHHSFERSDFTATIPTVNQAKSIPSPGLQQSFGGSPAKHAVITDVKSLQRPRVSPPKVPIVEPRLDDDELEVERIMLEELTRLETKPYSSLSIDQQNRYRALRRELEIKRDTFQENPLMLENAIVKAMSNFEETGSEDQEIPDSSYKTPEKAEIFDNNEDLANILEKRFVVDDGDRKKIYVFEREQSHEVDDAGGRRAQVLGAQEVYKDPRHERLKNLQQNLHNSHENVEKLSFKDKMKLFAKEVGEQTPPKDRLKSSSAQRDIEANVIKGVAK